MIFNFVNMMMEMIMDMIMIFMNSTDYFCSLLVVAFVVRTSARMSDDDSSCPQVHEYVNGGHSIQLISVRYYANIIMKAPLKQQSLYSFRQVPLTLDTLFFCACIFAQ